jgi:hypothetical protein
MAIGNRLALVILELANSKTIILSARERVSIEAIVQQSAENDGEIEMIRTLLGCRPDIVRHVGVAIVQKAFEFLDEELDYYEELKKQRKLTEDEIEYGRITLPNLVQSIVRLCTRPKSDATEKS